MSSTNSAAVGGSSSSAAEGGGGGAAVANADRQDPDPPVYVVNVKCIDGTMTKLEVPSDLRGSDIKELILERLEVPVDTQRLIFRGRVVQDDDMIGSHVTESGQTLHMVQRPVSSQGAGNAPNQSTSSGGEGQPNRPTAHAQGGPQVQFQFAFADGQNLPMPQVDLSQILSTVLGAVGRGGATAPAPSGPRPPGAGSGRTAAPPASSAPTHGPPTMMGPGLHAQPLHPQPGLVVPAPVMMSTGPVAGVLPGTFVGMTSGGIHATIEMPTPQGMRAEPGPMPMPPEPHGPPPPPPFGLPTPSTWPPFGPPPEGAPGPQGGVSWQPMPAMPRPGDDGSVLPADLAAPGQLPRSGSTSQSSSGPGGSDRRRHAGQKAASRGSLPWNDLRRLHQHLARLLGRNHAHRSFPPSNLPSGELHAFLSMMIAANSQINVALSDLQEVVADGSEVPARQRLQLAMSLMQASRTFHRMATTLQNGPAEDGQIDASASSGTGSAQANAGAQAMGEVQPLANVDTYSDDALEAEEERETSEMMGLLPQLLGQFAQPPWPEPGGSDLQQSEAASTVRDVQQAVTGPVEGWSLEGPVTEGGEPGAGSTEVAAQSPLGGGPQGDGGAAPTHQPPQEPVGNGGTPTTQLPDTATASAEHAAAGQVVTGV